MERSILATRKSVLAVDACYSSGSAAEIIQDIRDGGDYGAAWVDPDDDRVFLHVWPNGALVQVLCHQEPQPNEHPSDRIRLVCVSKDGNMRGWLMNDQDAAAIIAGLTRALEEYDETEKQLQVVTLKQDIFYGGKI